MKKKTIDIKTQERILASAKKIFYLKGLDGARMQEIADEAEINKAMLHYYFRNKEALFDAVFAEATENILPQISELLNLQMPLIEKISVSRKCPNASRRSLTSIDADPSITAAHVELAAAAVWWLTR